MADDFSIFTRLTETLRQRNRERLDSSYTAALLAGGVEKIGAKLREEVAEVLDAALELDTADRAHLVREAADVVFHLMVLLELREATLRDVANELVHREGKGGLAEKQLRPLQ
ncbi:MAG: phosphoribosyl-ATP diphosphatase [Planctomycetia bacterium]|nr:phosphoribosyl-ATP diphosphatase [Planctomycetia bacterium]